MSLFGKYEDDHESEFMTYKKLKSLLINGQKRNEEIEEIIKRLDSTVHYNHSLFDKQKFKGRDLADFDFKAAVEFLRQNDIGTYIPIVRL